MNNINNKIEDKIVHSMTISISSEVTDENIYIHPVRYIEAVKSLIGLNLNNPNKILINFLNNLVIKTDIQDQVYSYNESRTISLNELEKTIRESNYSKCIESIDDILNLSDGRHIMEFFLELSLLQSGKSLSFICSLFRSMNFIGYSSRKIVRNALIRAGRALILDSFYKLRNKDEYSIDKIFSTKILNYNEIQIVGSLYEISNTNFIREKMIETNINSYLSYLKLSLKNSKDLNYYLESCKDIKEMKKRSDLLNEFKDIELEIDLILLVNSLRACMKNMLFNNKLIIPFYLQHLKNIL